MTEDDSDLGIQDPDPNKPIRKCPDCGFQLEDATAQGGPAYLKGYTIYICKLNHHWAKRK